MTEQPLRQAWLLPNRPVLRWSIQASVLLSAIVSLPATSNQVDQAPRR